VVNNLKKDNPSEGEDDLVELIDTVREEGEALEEE